MAFKPGPGPGHLLERNVFRVDSWTKGSRIGSGSLNRVGSHARAMSRMSISGVEISRLLQNIRFSDPTVGLIHSSLSGTL